MPSFRLRSTARAVNLGGGHFIEPGQTAELTAEQAAAIPGMEPVLERDTPRSAIEGQRGASNVDHHPGERSI